METTTENISDSPFVCKACGKETDGTITINGKGICKDCFRKFDLEDKLGITIEDLFGVME